MSGRVDNIGRFRVTEELGRGGMGVVYKAFDPGLERAVAIKRLTLVTEEYLERFRQEAKAAARLQHENITIIYESGDDHGEPYIVMEFLDGESLRTAARKLASVPEKLDVMRQVCEGLHYAHAQGIAAHRDIKPANIQITKSGRVKLMDFGIAKLADELHMTRNLTQANTVLGTLYYLSPEQIRGEKLDGRSDVWSVGVVLHELLYGDRPFEDEEEDGVMKKIVLAELPDLRPIDSPCEESVHHILRRALEKDRDRRYLVAGEMAADLHAAIRAARTPSVVLRPQKTAKQCFEEGRAHYEAGNFARAIDAFRKVLELKPGHRGASANVEICERVQRAKHGEELKRLGILLFKNREWRLSIATLEELLTIEASDEDARTLINWARREVQRDEDRKLGDLSDIASATLQGISRGDLDDAMRVLEEPQPAPSAVPEAGPGTHLERFDPASGAHPGEAPAPEAEAVERDRSTGRVSAWLRRFLSR